MRHFVPSFWLTNQTSWINFLQHVAGTKFCPYNRTFSLKRRRHTREIFAATQSLLYVHVRYSLYILCFGLFNLAKHSIHAYHLHWSSAFLLHLQTWQQTLLRGCGHLTVALPTQRAHSATTRTETQEKKETIQLWLCLHEKRSQRQGVDSGLACVGGGFVGYSAGELEFREIPWGEWVWGNSRGLGASSRELPNKRQLRRLTPSWESTQGHLLITEEGKLCNDDSRLGIFSAMLEITNESLKAYLYGTSFAYDCCIRGNIAIRVWFSRLGLK